MYNAYITRIKNLHKHPNADRLQIGECFGNAVIVSMEYEDNQLGIYFPSDGQLSVEFAEANNLLRKKDDAGNNIGGYMDPDKRNVTAIKLRGEKSDGLFLPLKALESFGDITTLREGDRIDNFNGYEICCKYIPRRNVRHGHLSNGNKTRKHKAPIAPLFSEHADTEQLAYNLGAFKSGDEIEITLKMHGTSQRTGYLPVLKGYKRTLMDKILRREGKPIYDWGYVSGTRRTVLENFEGGYYGSNEFREAHSKFFEGKLNKGEEIFYEVVGFTHTGAPIMASGDNKKLNDKDFVKQYGQTTVFSYGCSMHPIPAMLKAPDFVETCAPVPQSDIYVYRMTMTNEDGFTVEYTPDFMRYRCEQMGVKCVPVFGKATISDDRLHLTAPDGYDHDYLIGEGTIGDMIVRAAEDYYDGPDPVGKTHIREGVVVRIINRPKFCAYKHKNWFFKALEGIVKVEAEAPDIEEAEETNDDN
jgi:RNA ligase (TIGR02306 family)